MTTKIKLRANETNIGSLLERTIFQYADDTNQSVDVSRDETGAITYRLNPKTPKPKSVCHTCEWASCGADCRIFCELSRQRRVLAKCEECALNDEEG